MNAADIPPPACVIVLHGMGRTACSMKRVEWSLKREGYRVINATYPSTRLSIQELADDWLNDLIEQKVPRDGCTIHFVTHSLGGIVVRQYLSTHRLERLGRVVMLGPPNQGSEMASRLRTNFFYRLLTGPAGQELGIERESTPNRLGPVNFPVGVIAGSRSFGRRRDFAGPNDGKVAVARTQVEGMTDFAVIHATHTWMMCHPRVLRAVTHFLRGGRLQEITSASPVRM